MTRLSWIKRKHCQTSSGRPQKVRACTDEDNKRTTNSQSNAREGKLCGVIWRDKASNPDLKYDVNLLFFIAIKILTTYILASFVSCFCCNPCLYEYNIYKKKYVVNLLFYLSKTLKLYLFILWLTFLSVAIQVYMNTTIQREIWGKSSYETLALYCT